MLNSVKMSQISVQSVDIWTERRTEANRARQYAKKCGKFCRKSKSSEIPIHEDSSTDAKEIRYGRHKQTSNDASTAIQWETFDEHHRNEHSISKQCVVFCLRSQIVCRIHAIRIRRFLDDPTRFQFDDHNFQREQMVRVHWRYWKYGQYQWVSKWNDIYFRIQVHYFQKKNNTFSVW